MPTFPPIAAGRRFSLVGLLLVALLAGASGAHRPSRVVVPEQLEGRAPTPEELQPSVEAAFRRQSYAPGATASLVLFNRANGLTLQLFETGPEHTHVHTYSEMQGVAVSAPRQIGRSNGHRVLTVTLGHWPSGLYFARLTASDGRVGFAPFVLRPSWLGEHRIAVVMPTLTWQAYNLRDDDHNGTGDSWYASWSVHHVHLARPFLNRGVPYCFGRYDLPFLHWLSWTHRDVDVLADSDLYSARSGKQLAQAYDLIVFPGHHEYVTTREYDLVRRYRDLGGNLAFLSANNFFWQVVRHGDTIERTQEWRKLGRPEAALIGTQYRGNDNGRRRGPWIVRDATAGAWLFAGTGLERGSTFASGGIEIDKTSPASPPGTKVLAEIPNLFGPGFTAQMTYYRTRTGAQVFAAGAFTLSGEVLSRPIVGRMMENLWAQLAKP